MFSWIVIEEIFGLQFTYLGSSISSTEKDIDMRLTKAWTTIDKLSIIWKSDLTNKMKCSSLPGSGRVDTAVWMHYLGTNKMAGEEARRQLHKNAASQIEQSGGNTQQGTNYTATCLPSRKLSKLDEPDMQDTAGKAGMSS